MINRIDSLNKPQRLDLFLVSDNPWLASMVLKMYWRYHLNSEFGFSMRGDEVKTEIEASALPGPIEDFFCVKTDVKHKKRPPVSIEAEKVGIEDKETG